MPEKNPNLEKPSIRRISGLANETVIFTGFGWGHGLGLSQWGAKAMAEKAPAGDTAYFRQILKHYYTGIEISKLY
jgi:stage II sporulation protein D